MAARFPFLFEQLERRYLLRHRFDALGGVAVARRRVRLRSGEELAYEALVVAVGARPQSWLEGALTFTGSPEVPAVRELLEHLRNGRVETVVLSAPPDASWTLPLDELALLTSTWCKDHGVIAPRISIATPEMEPLVVFGPAGARAVRALLEDRGIILHAGTTVFDFDGRDARLARGVRVPADAVVALPRLLSRPIPGLPSDGYGFSPVDDHGAVSCAPGVYAVGDVTTHSVKQGGLAAQQADAAAAAIARDFGVPVDAAPLRPVLRGVLLTGVTAAYLRQADGRSEAAFQSLWWPPTKVAGRYLSALLTDLHGVGEDTRLPDRAASNDLKPAAEDRQELRRLALGFAEADAQSGDHPSALRWLQSVEWLDGVLSPAVAELRDRWRTHLQAAARTAV